MKDYPLTSSLGTPNTTLKRAFILGAPPSFTPSPGVLGNGAGPDLIALITTKESTVNV